MDKNIFSLIPDEDEVDDIQPSKKLSKEEIKKQKLLRKIQKRETKRAIKEAKKAQKLAGSASKPSSTNTPKTSSERQPAPQPVTQNVPERPEPVKAPSQQNFIQQVPTPKPIKATPEKGKSYAISDLHGFLGSYQQAMSMLKPQDTIYILGDAIDRGKNGIKILLDIIERQKNPNGPKIHFILGNHEWQMVTCLDIIEKSNLSSTSELLECCNMGKTIYDIRSTENELKRLQKIPNKTENQKKEFQSDEDLLQKTLYPRLADSKNKSSLQNQVSEDDMMSLYIWIMANHGNVTFNEYVTLPQAKQDEIYDFLKSSYLLRTTTINNQDFCLVHAAPPDSQPFIKQFQQVSGKDAGIKAYSLPEDFLAYCTELRENPEPFKAWKAAGFKTIFGHTPAHRQIVRNADQNSICIDANCCHGGKLALYCLDDDTTRFIDSMEQDISKQQTR